jgi:hypothetical protein
MDLPAQASLCALATLPLGIISIRKEQEDFETIAADGVFIRSLRKDLLQRKENLRNIIKQNNLLQEYSLITIRLALL